MPAPFNLVTRALLALASWAAVCTGAAADPAPLGELHSWAVFYGATAPLDALQAPDLLVLEPDQPWHPATLRRPGQKVIAYLSLGEVNMSRPYYKALAHDHQAIAGKNPNWPGAMMIDPRSQHWQHMVLDHLAGQILAKGYDGLFLDTLDTAAFLERDGKHPGAIAAMADMLQALHRRYPRALLLANGGLDLLPRAATALSGVAVESVYTDYQFKPKHYQPREATAAQARAESLSALAKQYRLPFLVIEYVDPQQSDARAAVAQQVRQAGFVPFVSDIGLVTLEATP